MTISSQSRKAGPFIGNGVTVAFPFAFKVFAASDVYVVRATDTGTESVLTVGTHYSVTLNSNQNSNPGGTVTLGAALASNYKLVITSAVPNLQPVDITNNGGFYPKVINDALDRVTIMAQQLALDSSRAVKLPITSALTGDEFTAQLFNARDEAVDSAAAASVSATGAANSATSASASASTATTKASEASTSASGAATSATAASGSATAAAGSATTAGNSASTATTKAGEAASSATAAASSATASAGSATTATTKAGEATTAAAAAAGSQTAAASSASSAGTSATNASNSATSASNSATSATSSASAASTSASQAATSATNAANSATSAAGSATTASTAATTATGASSTAVTSASTATTQATNAATSATAAASSATSAASSAAAAAAALDSFDDRYLGAKTSNPTLDNDGNALMQGALYYRSTAPIGMKVYDGSQWIEASAAQQASLVTFEYVATTGQTSFSGNDANGVSLSYTVGNVLVSVNGVRLRPGDDFTASTGTSIVLASAASVGDEILVDAFKTFDVANTYTQAQVDGLLGAKAPQATTYTKSEVDTALAGKVNKAGDTITGDLNLAQSAASNIVRPLLLKNTATFGNAGQGVQLSMGNDIGSSHASPSGWIKTFTNNGASGASVMIFGGFTGSAQQEHMFIEPGGQIRQPLQPAFHAYFSNSQFSPGSGTLVFDATYVNIGNCYNPAIGRFTAPVPGRYFFHGAAQHYGGSGTNGFCEIYKNGSAVRGARAEHASGANFQTSNASCVLSLNTGDFVDFANAAGANVWWSDASSFSGHFIG